MNCTKCGAVLRDGGNFCHMCGISRKMSVLPEITGNEWFSFIKTGRYTLKYKFSSDLQILCGGRNAGLLAHFSDEANNNHYYDLVQSENDNNSVVRFIRNDNDLQCVDPATGQVFFTWLRQSSSLGELASGSKWQNGSMTLGQSGARSLAQWLPGIIGWMISSKYTIMDCGRTVGAVKGSSASFSNSKTVELLDTSRAWEVLAVAIILSDDELG